MENVVYRNTPFFYIMGLVIYIMIMISSILIWHYPTFVLKYLALLFLLLHLFLNISLYNFREMIILFISFPLFLAAGINSHSTIILILFWLLIVGAKGIPYKLILKAHIITGVIYIVISFLGSNMGLFENRVVTLGNNTMDLLGETSYARYCFGYVWPTDYANHISFVCITYWMIKKRALNKKEIISFFLLSYFILEYTKTRQATITIVLVVLCSLYLNYKKKRKSSPSSLIQYFSIFSVPFFSFLSVYFTIEYDSSNPFYYILNILFTGRLYLGQDAINQYGVNLFGNYFKLEGSEANYLDYNYVDSSYLQAFLFWGIILSIILLIAFVNISHKANIRKDYELLFAIAIMAYNGVFCQYLFQVHMCPLLLALFANHNTGLYKIQYKNVKKRRIKRADFKSYS